MLTVRWQRAAMLGSLWAANEIVLGSFLHNIGIPFTGTVLASIGVALLVAGWSFWRDPGVLWRAGVVCSLMKSISPSAIILGPMAGILLEAAVVTAVIVLTRGVFPGLILAGMAATVTPILQAIVMIMMKYGIDAARMYHALFTLLAERLDLSGADPVQALLMIIAVQTVPGALAAWAGAAAARMVDREKRSIAVDLSSLTDGDDPLRHADGPFALPLLGVHVLVLVAGLLLLPLLPPVVAPLPVAAWLAVVLFRYPVLRRRFRRPGLWLELAAVAVLAGILLGALAPGGRGTWWSGLQSGIMMASRAALVVTAFSAISIELRNPIVLDWFLRRGLGTLAAAMRMAFRVLPVMFQVIGAQRDGLHHPLRTLSRIFASMLAVLEGTAQRTVHIITGPQGSGKTALLGEIARALRARGQRVAGFLSHVVFENGQRVGYDIELLDSGERLPLCRTVMEGAEERIGPFAFSPAGLAAGRRALAAAAAGPVDAIIVDEVGPLELQGGGWAAPVRPLLQSGGPPVVFSCRPDLPDALQAAWTFRAMHVWESRSAGADMIAAALRADGPGAA